ncbi:MAG: C25 family cysteine peptidase [Candidatus Marinimicrobia bacterium]|nr:C25 family cysteine peptidase [Candidatus Neomarinimicrobiota bacterium]
MNCQFFIFGFLLFFSSLEAKTSWSVMHLSPDEIRLKVKSEGNYAREIEPLHCLIGLPDSQTPEVEFSYSAPLFLNDAPASTFPLGVSWLQFQLLRGLHTGTLAISPFSSEGIAYDEVIVTIHIPGNISTTESSISPGTASFMNTRVINWEFAKHWVKPIQKSQSKILNIPSYTVNVVPENTDYIIIGASEYETNLMPLINLRRNSFDEPLNTNFASTDSIFQVYSNGNLDAQAIKDFLYDALSLADELTFGLLVGDIPNLPTLYEGDYASDDLFATFNGGIPEIALGRFPAKTSGDVQAFVSKVIQYETDPEYGLWRQRITLVADDEARPLANDTSHTSNSEKLAQIIPPQFDVEKVYLMEYPGSNDASLYGVTKPEATEDLFNLLSQGTTIVNFIGHGSYYKWAQESILDKNRGDISFIQTGNKLPLWIVGTCSWGEFDNPAYDAFSEDIIRLVGNGAIAIITTSRSVYEGPNWIFLRTLYEAIFPNGGIADIPLGNILQSIKTGSITGKVFHLFGDPAMKIQFPVESIDLTISEPLEILSQETASSHFLHNGGTGFLVVRESDRMVEREYSYISNSGLINSSISYSIPGSILSLGEISFSGSQVSGSFWIPMDIMGSKIDIKMYVQNENDHADAIGFKEEMEVSLETDLNDYSGPDITFFTSENREVGYGDHVAENSNLILSFSDQSGINLAGEPGHEIQLTKINSGEVMFLTNQFIYNLDDITSGTISLDLNEFTFPFHINIQCWDNANNSSNKNILLKSLSGSGLKLFNVYNYPNPFKDDTQFTFEITENAQVSITIYTLGGTKIKVIPSDNYPGGYHHVYWDGKDAFGKDLSNGVFIYRINAKGNNETITKFNRLAVIK